jgi:hypothetical protein
MKMLIFVIKLQLVASWTSKKKLKKGKKLTPTLPINSYPPYFCLDMLQETNVLFFLALYLGRVIQCITRPKVSDW